MRMGSLRPRIRALYRLLRARLTGRTFPVFLTLGITGECNARCVYCYHDGTERSHMPTARVLPLIDELAARGMAYLSLSGGEPLLHPDVDAIAHRARSRGVECHLCTNGYLLPERARGLREVDAILLSLDGDEKTNDRNRGDGAYRRSMRGLESALAEGIPVIINAVITRHTAGSIYHVVDIARDRGVWTKFSFLDYSGPERCRRFADGLAPGPEQVAQALARIAFLKREGAPILFSRRTYRISLDWHRDHPGASTATVPDRTGLRCRAGALWGEIDSAGGFFPCCTLFDTFTPKNVFSDGLDEAVAWARDRNPCRSCFKPGHIEHNLVCGLVPGVLAESVLTAAAMRRQSARLRRVAKGRA